MKHCHGCGCGKIDVVQLRQCTACRAEWVGPEIHNWPDVLATNLTWAASLCESFERGYSYAVWEDYPYECELGQVSWTPGCGRPAPGWKP